MKTSSGDQRIRTNLQRLHYYLISLIAAFLIPLILSAAPVVFTFAILLTLMVWFSVRWQRVARITTKPTVLEATAGATLLIANIMRNIVSSPKPFLGLFDMLVSFLTLSIIFYGFKGLKLFWIPAIYMLVLVAAYQLELIAEEVEALENSLAKFMTFTMAAMGIKAILLGRNVLQLFTPYGPYFLEIAGPCTGVKGMLAYGSLAVLMLLDEKASLKKKIFIAFIGILGTFMTNLIRLNIIFLVVYGFGIDAGLFVHAYLGYSLFMVWILVFWSMAFKYLSAPPKCDGCDSAISMPIGIALLES